MLPDDSKQNGVSRDRAKIRSIRRSNRLHSRETLCQNACECDGINNERERIMGEFFHGWHRKLGCLMLLMACAFMSWWIRGYHLKDEIWLWQDDMTWVHSLAFSHQGIFWESVEVGYRFPVPVRFNWSVSQIVAQEQNEFGLSEMEWRWQCLGFDFGRCHGVFDRGTHEFFCRIPFWSVVLPPTLTSAFLLLSKPRKSTQTKILEPAINNGT
jgi:hypothetical protein